MNKIETAAWIAGMIDGEGHISMRRRRTIDRVVRIANTDLELISAVVDGLTDIGITSTVLEMKRTTDDPNRRTCWEVNIYGRQNFRLLYDLVPIQSSRKLDALREIVNSYVFPLRPTEGVLRELYEEREMTIKEVAQELSLPPGTVYNWIVKRGIERRRPGYISRLKRESGYRRTITKKDKVISSGSR